MKFTLEIELGNDAMQNGADVAAALYTVANKIDGFEVMRGDRGTIRDGNGNTVGRWEIAE